jgi:hypothetical protein
MHRGPPCVDGEQIGFVKNLDDESHEENFHHRGKDEIGQNGEAQLWNIPGSELSLCIPIKVLELTSERIRPFREQK